MLCIALLAVVVRETCDLRHARVQGAPEQGWFTLDPDSLYHMRRVERALDEGLPPAETDPRMNAPVGARIPWPPYYTYVAWAACAPFAPENPDERARHIEERAATLPCVFAALASVLLALTARRLARERTESEQLSAAAIAGGTYALLGASLQYSAIGNGDHHAWVVLLLAAIAFVASKALRGDELDDARLGLRNGVLLGVLCGLLVGSWVGGLVYAVLLEIALGLALFAHSKRARRGLAALGLGMHAAWAITIAPAVLSSPWKDEQPWMLVNASWLHLAHPLLGALVFLPLLREGSERLRVRWPWLVAAALVALCSALAFADFALARGVREGFAWASRSNEFMAFITESQPLLWGPIGGFGPLTELLGFGVLLSPIALGWLVLVAWRERRLELAFVAILFAALLAQALTQRRFADAFGVPLALALALFFARALERFAAPSNGMASALGLVIALAAGFPTLRLAQARAETSWYEIERDPARERRGLYERLRDLPGSDEPVLASWDHGHAIEWIARKPSIATNFGSYLGRDSYLDPWRFFLESDPRAAEELLRSRGARYVLMPGNFTKDLEVMLRLLRPEERRAYLLIPRAGSVFTSQRFLDTLAGRLLMGGRVADLDERGLVGDSLDFLRLVHVSPSVLPVPPPIRHTNGPVRTGWIWERVEGARVRLQGRPGARARIELDLECSQSKERWTFLANAVLDAEGVATLRVPYCTDARNGDTLARGPARATIGEQVHPLAIRESDVLQGGTLTVP
jgi:asparagine N-glycosylation enzyme membrane subunit Stt3